MASPVNSQANDLRLVSQIDENSLRDLVESLDREPSSIRLSSLKELISYHLKESAAVGALFRWLYFIRTVMVRQNTPNDPRVIFSSFADAARNEDQIDVSEAIVDLVSNIAGHEKLYSVWQAQNLSRDAEHLYQAGTVVVDIRPVFDESRTFIVGEVIMPFLKLSYSQDGDVKTISVALDARDIDQIEGELSKLKRKLEVLRSRADGVERYLVGEEADFAFV